MKNNKQVLLKWISGQQRRQYCRRKCFDLRREVRQCTFTDKSCQRKGGRRKRNVDRWGWEEREMIMGKKTVRQQTSFLLPSKCFLLILSLFVIWTSMGPLRNVIHESTHIVSDEMRVRNCQTGHWRYSTWVKGKRKRGKEGEVDRVTSMTDGVDSENDNTEAPFTPNKLLS